MSKQYPNIPSNAQPKSTVANLVNSLGNLDLYESDDDDTDNEALQTSSVYMISRVQKDPPSDVIDVRAHFEYCNTYKFYNKIYATTDGGTDSCILGKNAKVLSYTGRYANLIGYDPNTTLTEKVPIVTALIKAVSSTAGNHPVLLKVYEAPYNPSSPITLLSEYQVREYGLIIDYVAKKHRASHTSMGTQKFHLSADVHIDFEDRGDLWALRYYPLKKEMRTFMTLFQ